MPSPLVDLQHTAPPDDWGVTVDSQAIDELAAKWASDAIELPSFDYPGTPADRDESWWLDYVTLAVSVLACLWAPEGDETWHTELDGQWLDDAPGIFAVCTRAHRAGLLTIENVAMLADDEAHAWFDGTGTLQLIPERVTMLRDVAQALMQRWDGSARNLVTEANRDGTRIAALLSETIPGYQDRPETAAGTLAFDKLSHLAAAIMAAGLGWQNAGFANYDDFPVYPDYMLPRVLRHFHVINYSPELASTVDNRTLIPAGSQAEHAIRWATVYAGAQLRSALHARENPVAAPALDYRLWSEAVLGDHAHSFGEHHRTITMRY